MYARINGGVYSAGISTGQKITSTPIRLGTWMLLSVIMLRFKAISITGWISHSQFSSGEEGYTHTLTTIPRQANITEVAISQMFKIQLLNSVIRVALI